MMLVAVDDEGGDNGEEEGDDNKDGIHDFT